MPIQLREERDFSLDVNELASLITDRTRLIILNSPQNPTGGVLERRDIEQIANIIGDRNVMILSDEIYSRLLFDGGQHFSIMSVPGMQERTILLDGFSKTYAMTGWRMGYGVMRPDLAAHMTRSDDEFQFLHRQLHAGCGHRGDSRRPEFRGSHARRIPAASRCIRGGAEQD